MIVSGSISGNLVMNEKDGQPTHILLLYAAAIVVILFGLQILVRGEQASQTGGTLLDGRMQPAEETGTQLRACSGTRATPSASPGASPECKAARDSGDWPSTEEACGPSAASPE